MLADDNRADSCDDFSLRKCNVADDKPPPVLIDDIRSPGNLSGRM